MSASEESLNDQDPDYVSTTSNDQIQQNIYEENARNNTAAKIREIVEKEFSQEIDSKEKEILQIQERLQEALKIFHLLRYVIITNFYNRKQCQNLQPTETTKQTRIHPAVKSLLGKYPKSTKSIDFAVPSTSTDPKFLYNDESFASGSKISTNDACKSEKNTDKDDAQSSSQSTKRNLSDEEDRPRKVPRYVPPKSISPEKTPSLRGNSHKVRKRIIIGNISKWIPPDWREDAFSHKWTMYVHGDKDNRADINNFVSKVRFFLHPSYRPNDVVEITSYPFHLSRRGWGEFPLRVQLHFKNPRNKPVDIIHHLKLDRTYTGLQTLGSETLVDVWIHMMEPRSLEQASSSESVESSANCSVKIEPSGDGSEFICKQLVKSAGTSDLTVSTIAENQIKKKIIDSEVREQIVSSMDSIEKQGNVRVEAESSATVNIINDENGLGEMPHYSVVHDHDYSKRRYFDSRHCTVKEGNITIAHFSDNDVAKVSQMLNSDVQSSDSSQSLVDSNFAKDNLQITSANTAFQANDSQKNLKESTLFDANKSIQARKSKSKDTLINGFCKLPSTTSLDRMNNLQNSSNPCNMKPLQISIPSSNVFASPSNKHVLLLKNKKSISVDVTSILSSSEKNSKRFDSDLKTSIIRDDVKQNIRISQGVSILKKPPNSKANAQQDGIDNKKTVVLTLNSTNSLLLNVNDNVPILKIAEARDYGYSHAETTRDVVASKQEIASCKKPTNKSLVQRPKVTLGKDKYKIHSKRELYEAVLRSIDTANIADTEALIRFIARRLPLVTRDARDPEYRQLHPYACTSEEEYFAQNVGKQRAVEWSRAKMIRCFLQKRPIPTDQLWSVKEILIWARLHGYTPTLNTFGILQTAIGDARKLCDTTTSTATRSSCTEPIALHKWLQTSRQDSSHQKDSDIEEIDVENEDGIRAATDRKRNDDNRGGDCSTALVPLELDESLMPFHNFVCDTARDIGVRIVPEEIVPGVLYSATSRVMMRAVECFVEDLTRSALAKALERNSGNECPTVVMLDDVRKALMSREEFDIFTNEGLGSGLQLSSTELSNL